MADRERAKCFSESIQSMLIMQNYLTFSPWQFGDEPVQRIDKLFAAFISVLPEESPRPTSGR
jgi:hypothetical protein